MVYSARWGVGTAAFTKLSATGALAPTVAIAPGRGAGFGLGEGHVRFAAATPDGSRVVLTFQDRSTRGISLHAVSTDGTDAAAPVLVARSVQGFDYALSPDGSEIVFAGDGALLRASLDGSMADQPARVAELPGRLSYLHWIPEQDRVAFITNGPGQNERTLFSALVDGSQADTPTKLSPQTPGNYSINGFLPDGRVVAQLSPALWVIPPAGGTPVRITPEGPRSSGLRRVFDGGDRVLVELWDNQDTDTFITVSTDGSQADRPVSIAPEFSSTTSENFSNERGLAIITGRSGVFSSMFELQYDPPAAATRLIDMFDGVVTDLSTDGRVGVGCEEGAIKRYDFNDTGVTRTTLVEFPADLDRCPWPTLWGQDNYLAYSDDSTWVMPIAGGTASRVGARPAEVLPTGVLSFKDTGGWAALYKQTSDMVETRLSIEHVGGIEQSFLPAGSSYVYYKTADTGWHAANLDGSDAEQARALRDVPATASFVTSRGTRGLFWAAEPRRLLSVDAAMPALTPITLGAHHPGGAPLLLDDDVVVLEDRTLMRRPLDGSQATTLATEVLQSWTGGRPYVMDPARNQLLLAVRRSDGTTLVGVKADGSEATTPRVIVSELPQDFYGLSPPVGDSLFIITAEFTGVAHPHGILVASLDGSDMSGARPVGAGRQTLALPLPLPRGDATETTRPIVSPDGSSLLVYRGRGLWLAPVDGMSDGDPTPALDPGTLLDVSPSGRWVLAVSAEDGALYRVPLVRGQANTRLTPGLPNMPSAVRWLDDGAAIAFALAGGNASSLHIARSSGEDRDALVDLVDEPVGGAGTGVKTLEVVGERLIFNVQHDDGTRKLFQTTVGRRATMGSPLGVPRAVTPLTRVTDAHEHYVGDFE
ncbi:MAG: hypothetical protein OXR73_34150 [Myxococcales bacterium]|nr:hypothetical protein [Myxococcales bacterium]